MLYEPIIKNLEPRVKIAVRELFKIAYQNQVEESDLLLVLENGFYYEKYANSENYPFVIGPNFQHYAEETQYQFYNAYRHTNIHKSDRSIYLNTVRGDREKELQYSLGTQLEMVQYLKLFESNRFLEKLFKLSQLCQGERYPWFFQIGKEDSRHDIIRNKIRDPLRLICPNFYALLKDIYLSQIRNAVAHSQFFILGIDISFLNYDPSNHAPLTHLKIEDWEKKFHLLTLLYNEYIHCQQMYNYIYIRKALGKHFGLPIKIVHQDGKIFTKWYHYDEKSKRWLWYDSWKSGINTFSIV